MSKPKRSPFIIRRRILEALILLWIAGYLYEQARERWWTDPPVPAGSATPVQAASPAGVNLTRGGSRD